MYQPKISDENIRKLYQLRVKKKKPMTRVLEDILNEYFGTELNNMEIEEVTKTLKELNLRRKIMPDYSCYK